MYDIIRSVIGHAWVSGSGAPGEQQYVYYTACALFLLFSVVFLDNIFKVFRLNRR